jgi:hypothetical protein
MQISLKQIQNTIHHRDDISQMSKMWDACLNECSSLGPSCGYVEVNDSGPAKIWEISFFNIITAGDSDETRPEPVESPGLEIMSICSLK